MARIMINCPETGKAVAVGMYFDQKSFDLAALSDNTFGPCAECGGSHTWAKKDAFLEGSSAASAGAKSDGE